MKDIKVSKMGVYADGKRKCGIVFPKEISDKIKIGSPVEIDLDNNVIRLSKIKKINKK